MNRTSVALLAFIALALGGWLAYTKVSSPTANAAAMLAPTVEGTRIYFVPIEVFPSEQIDALVQYYRQKYNLEITVLKNIPVNPSSRDQSRQQLIAEKLTTDVRNAIPEYANDPKAILIGFTTEDMYPLSHDWQFAFGWRQGSSRTAVVSTARMGLQYDGQPADSGADTRLRKMVSKDIGILYYGLPQSSNAKSVLYNQILGIQELDQVGEDF